MPRRFQHNGGVPASHTPATAPADALPSDDNTVVKIFESVRDSIVRGEVAPGAPINSVELAARFGTSRTPVREALLILNQYGLITMSARRRPRVAPVSVKAIRDLYALRSALHAYIARAIVETASEPSLQDLRARALALVEQGDASETDVHVQDIEDYLLAESRLCGNDVVLGVLDSLKWKINWFRRLGLMSREQLKVLALDRLRVADAYLDRDAPLAEALNGSMLRKAAYFCEMNFNARSSARPAPEAGG